MIGPFLLLALGEMGGGRSLSLGKEMRAGDAWSGTDGSDIWGVDEHIRRRGTNAEFAHGLECDVISEMMIMTGWTIWIRVPIIGQLHAILA